MCPVMRKPYFAARFTAKDSAPVSWLYDFDEAAALAAVKRPGDRLGINSFRMFPIQPFAVSGAKLHSLVCLVRYVHIGAAFQAAEHPQDFLSFWGRPGLMPVHSPAMSFSTAFGTAVFLRHPIGRIFSAAYDTYSLPFHQKFMISPVSMEQAMSLLQKGTKKRQHTTYYAACKTHRKNRRIPYIYCCYFLSIHTRPPVYCFIMSTIFPHTLL